jgi:ABC-type transport system involved in multi-copper enzyme maturation permease subunit
VDTLIWIVAARETLDNLMSLKFLFGTVLCLVLVAISTVISLNDYQSRMDEYDSAIAEFNGKPDIFRPRIHRKPEVLSIFVRGFEKRFGNVVQLYDSVPVRAGGFMGTSESAQFSAEFASIDLLFVVKVILSLLAIFLSYDAISGERERGTLKLALSRPVPRSSIILGKLIAGGVCLLIPLVMSFIIGVLILQLVGGVDFTSEDWLRISLIAGVGILCVMSFYMLGLVVSSRTRQAAISLLILLLIWIIGVFLIPGITTAAVDRYRLMMHNPGKNIAAINADFSGRRRDDPMPDIHADREVYARYRIKWDELEDEKNRSIWNLQMPYLNRLYSQADLVRWICRLSPSESCAYAAEAMARTDIEAYRSFMRYARSYHERHREFAKILWKDRDKFGEEREKYTKAVQAPPIPFAASFRSAAPDICLLAIFNILFFMLSILFFTRYDVH